MWNGTLVLFYLDRAKALSHKSRAEALCHKCRCRGAVMKRLAILVLTALLLAASRGTLISGQSRPASSPDPQSYSTATTAILVDVVVRDHKGKPVTDLTAADFEVFEDRVAQKIDTFTRVTRGGGIGVDVKWKQPGSTV